MSLEECFWRTRGLGKGWFLACVTRNPSFNFPLITEYTSEERNILCSRRQNSRFDDRLKDKFDEERRF